MLHKCFDDLELLIIQNCHYKTVAKNDLTENDLLKNLLFLLNKRTAYWLVAAKLEIFVE